MFKKLKRLIFLIIIIVALVYGYRFLKENNYLNFGDNGSDILPSAQATLSEDGQTLYSIEIPSQYLGDLTQEKLNQLINGSSGILSATLNDDGSAKLLLTADGRSLVLNAVSKSFDSTFTEILAQDSVISITHSENFSSFEVTVDGSVSGESRLTLASKLFAVGKAYASLAGTDTENIQVVVINSDTQQIDKVYNSTGIARSALGDAVDFVGGAIGEGISRIASGSDS